MMLRCSLIHIIIIILRYIIYSVYLCLSLGLGLFMSYLCHLIEPDAHACFFANFSEYLLLFWTITWMNKVNNFQIAPGQPDGVA